MVSLLKLARITEEGVRFLSPHDGTPMYVHGVPCTFIALISDKVIDARALDIPPKFNRLRHRYAARRRACDDIPGSC
jgi:hypothetical protein